MTKRWLHSSLMVLFLLALTGFSITEGKDRKSRKFEAELDGFQETPSTLSSPARGEFEAHLVSDNTIEFELTYSGFQTAALVAHIHLGRPATTGGVIAFLCGGGGKPACPQGSGTVTGTITPADVVGPAAQGIAPGEFDEFVAALRAEATYANVHSAAYPGGEIRGAIE